jgi:DNA-binding GntR family transcriptional regulator
MKQNNFKKNIIARDQIFESLKNDLITGVLKQGTLLSDSTLAGQMGVSVTPVREALIQLHQVGLVDRIPRKGYLITVVTIQMIHEIIEFRLTLERSAALLAVDRITDEQLESLEKYRKIEIVENDALSIENGILANTEFHLEIARAVRNSHLLRAIQQILDESARLQYLDYSSRGGIVAWPIDHGQIIDALKARDKVKVANAVELGLMETRDRLLRGG